MKTLSLLKAVLTCDMNMFKYSAGKNASTKKEDIITSISFLDCGLFYWLLCLYDR